MVIDISAGCEDIVGRVVEHHQLGVVDAVRGSHAQETRIHVGQSSFGIRIGGIEGIRADDTFLRDLKHLLA